MLAEMKHFDNREGAGNLKSDVLVGGSSSSSRKWTEVYTFGVKRHVY